MGRYKRKAEKRRRQAVAVKYFDTPGTGVFAATEGPVRAKVGAITYTGNVVGAEFHYVTSKGDAKVAHKFTVL